jgi:hypothetical protein
MNIPVNWLVIAPSHPRLEVRANTKSPFRTYDGRWGSSGIDESWLPSLDRQRCDRRNGEYVGAIPWFVPIFDWRVPALLKPDRA